jgi:hypothetical protein
VIHFTEPQKAPANGVDRVRCLIRILYHGLTGCRVKLPKGLGKNIMTEKQLCELLGKSGFEVASTETIKDASRSRTAQ